MLIKLRRTLQTPNSTAGDLWIEDLLVCHTLEDAWHMTKMPGITRIPAGNYRIGLRTASTPMNDRYRARFGEDFHKGMLYILGVPDFEYVYFHCGNRVEDTKGCVLVGSEIVAPTEPDGEYTLHGSEKAYREFYPIVRDALAKEKVWVQILDPIHQPKEDTQ